MKHYYAYSVDLENGQSSFSLIPLTKEAVYVEGKFFPQSERLVMVSPVSKEVFDLIEKFDDDGNMQFVRGTQVPKRERLRLNNNVNHQLKGSDILWFLENYVENAQFAKDIIDKSKLKLQPAANMETVEEVKKSLIITE
jgi:hypothetical protein